MKHRLVHVFPRVSILCAILLASCSRENGSSVLTQLATHTPSASRTSISGLVHKEIATVSTALTSTPTIPRGYDSEVIQPENVSQLSIIDEWGQGNVYGVALSPDENTIAVAMTSGVYLYDAKTLEQIQFIDLPIIRSVGRDYKPSQAVAFSPDGNFLAVGYDDILIWDLINNKSYRRIDNRIADFNVIKIAISPQSNTLAVLSMGIFYPCDSLGGNFALYSITSPRVMLYSDYFCPEAAQYNFAFTSDGNVVFAGIIMVPPWSGYSASIVDANTGELVNRLHFGGVIDSVSPDGSKIAIRPFDTFYVTEIIDIQSGNIIDKVDGIVLFLPGGNRLVANGKDWAVTTDEHRDVCAFTDIPDINLSVFRLYFTLTGNKLTFWNEIYQKVEIWDMSTCQLSIQMDIPIIGTNSLKYNADGSIIVTNDWYNISIHDGTTGGHKFTISGRFNHIPSQFYDISADGKKVVVVSDEEPYKITFWDAISGEEIKSVPATFGLFESIFINPGGDVVATIDSGDIRLWDVESKTLMKIIPGSYKYLYFNPMGNNFAVVIGNRIFLRNDHSGKIEKIITFGNERIPVAFSTDWGYLVLQGNDQIELWDLDGNKIRDFMEYPTSITKSDPNGLYGLLAGGTREYRAIKFSPNNKLLAAIRIDSIYYLLRFWDTSTGEIVRDIILPFFPHQLEFSPDGKKLTLLGDGIIVVLGFNKTR